MTGLVRWSAFLILAIVTPLFCTAFSPAPLGVDSSSAFKQSQTERRVASAISFDAITAPPPETEESKVGVLLLNLGGPETGDDVEGALRFHSFFVFISGSSYSKIITF